MLLEKNIKLPRNISSQIIKNGELTLVSFYSSLKIYAVGGAILNYKKQIKDLAKHTGMCERSVKDQIKKLINNNLAWVWGANLRLASRKDICNRYNVPDNSRCNTYIYSKVTDIKNVIRAQAIQDNQYHQAFHHKQNLKAKQKILAKSEANRQNKAIRAANKNCFNGISTKIKLSMKGVANIYGAKHSSTGLYWERKLKKEGFLKIQKQNPIKIMQNVSVSAYLKMKSANIEFNMFRMPDGTLYQNQPNQLYVMLNK